MHEGRSSSTGTRVGQLRPLSPVLPRMSPDPGLFPENAVHRMGNNAAAQIRIARTRITTLAVTTVSAKPDGRAAARRCRTVPPCLAFAQLLSFIGAGSHGHFGLGRAYSVSRNTRFEDGSSGSGPAGPRQQPSQDNVPRFTPAAWQLKFRQALLDEGDRLVLVPSLVRRKAHPATDQCPANC